jgi:disease resistance protein RPS2
MHDVTREMALWIAQEVEKDKHNFFVRSGSMLGEIPRIEEWKDARKVSLMVNEIEQLQEAPSCSHLSTLLLQRNNLGTINGVFFQYMPKLVILDLSYNWSLVELPSEISKLVSLEYLNASQTKLQNLASGLNELIRLKYLNVERTHIERIPRKLISNLQKLQTLKMRGDYVFCVDEELLEELESLEDLSTLTITICSNASFHKFQNSRKLQSCTTKLYLHNMKVIELSILLNMKRLESLWIENCDDKKMLEESDIMKVKEGDGGEKLQDIGPSMTRFHNLHSVHIIGCNQVVDLTWLFFAPNVTHIRVFGCSALEEIINREKLGKNEDLNQLFAKLEVLELRFLPSLRSICKCALSFPHLERLYVSDCPKLKKLPINSSTAAKDNTKFTIQCDDREWWRQLEWEDEATRIAFTNRCYCFEYKVVDLL